MDFTNLFETAKPVVIALALKVAGAIVLYIIGRWLIGLVGTLINKALERQKIEPTVIRYIGDTINVVLNVLLVIGILGYFGVETTSFAALIAALGIAIGAAWGGLLSNFAAGVFILVLRPFKVGDYVLAGEVIANVMPEPKPNVEVVSFTERGPVLAVRPYVHTRLLAGVFRYQQGDPRHLRRGRLPGRRSPCALPERLNALPDAT